jgi:hypothetical protein
MDVLKELPKWALIAALAYAGVLISYAVYDNRSVELFPPKISARAVQPEASQRSALPEEPNSLKAPDPNEWVSKSDVEKLYIAKDVVQRDYVLRSAVPPALPSFASGVWHHVAFSNAGGGAVQDWLNNMSPPADGVVVQYDGSAHNTFHVWYRGRDSGTRYKYQYGSPGEFIDPAPRNFFLPDQTLIPAGIGGAGNDAVPIYFVASH